MQPEPFFSDVDRCFQMASSVYVGPQIGTNSIRLRGIPIWEFFRLPAHFHTVKSNRLDLALSYLDSHDIVTGYNPTT